MRLLPAVAGTDVAVILCSDVFDRPTVPFSFQRAASLLRAQAPAAQVIAVRELCARLSELPDAFSSLRVPRVVVGCARGKEREQRIRRTLRDKGAHPSGLQVVDLSSTSGGDPVLAGHQLVARLRAAVARASSGDLNAPISERAPGMGASAFSRRDLFRFGCSAPHPVVAWAAGSCTGQGAARPCVASCPRGALSCQGSRVTVDSGRCTGCGACIRTCGTGALTLNGACLAELEASGNCLADEARGLGFGVMIVCSQAANVVRLGSGWLPLEVPSLEIVTAGWALQYVAAGVPVALMGCAEAACSYRARKVAGFASSLLGQVAPEHRRMVVLRYDLGPARAVAADRGACTDVPPSAFRLHFREPEATVLAAQHLVPEDQQLVPLPGSWRLESPSAPLGEIDIDQARCSGCGCCVQACSSGALSMAAGQWRGLAFDFDPRACSACEACVRSCPEGAVSLTRAVSSSILSGGRRVIAGAAAKDQCPLCGRATGASPVSQFVASRLAGSHPEVAARLRAQGGCVYCVGTRVASSGLVGAGLASAAQGGTQSGRRRDAGHASPSDPL